MTECREGDGTDGLTADSELMKSCGVTSRLQRAETEMRRCGVWTLGHDVIIVTAELTISHLRLLNTDTGTEDRLVKLTPMPKSKIYTSSGEREAESYLKDLV